MDPRLRGDDKLRTEVPLKWKEGPPGYPSDPSNMGQRPDVRPGRPRRSYRLLETRLPNGLNRPPS